MISHALRTNSATGHIVVTQDGGLGSSGKGCLNAWLATETDVHWDISVNSWMPNAGHWVTTREGERILTQQVSSSFLNRSMTLAIGAGAAIQPDLLLSEVERLDKLGYGISSRLKVHPHAAIIDEDCRQLERDTLKHGSTFKGCGAALSRKALRVVVLAKDCPEISKFIDPDFDEWMLNSVYKGANIIVEGAQGVDLDLNYGEYPYCTSRQTIPGQIAADCGIPMNMVSNVILNWRTYPIRISNQSAADGTDKYSGNCFGAPELSWDEVATRAGYTPEAFRELYGEALLTSVTRKERRVFEFPKDRARFVTRLCGGSDGFLLHSLNFANFVDPDARSVTPKIEAWIAENLPSELLENLTLIRWGSKPQDCALL